MSWSAGLPLLVLGASLVPALAILLWSAHRHPARVALCLGGALTKLVLVGVMLGGVTRGERYEWRGTFLLDLDLVLRADPIGLLLVSLAAVLWLLTTIYAVGYLQDAPRQASFFGFSSLSVAAIVGVALAGNPVTFLLFFELLTVATYPLVVHRGTRAALAAGTRYLVFALTGGAVLLAGVLVLHTVAGPVDFTTGGVLSGSSSRGQLTALFVGLVAAVGVKAAIVPLHLWLPGAHSIAPGPASALLSGLTVNAGAFGIARIVFDVYGLELATDLGLLGPLAVLAAVTIVYGSLRALAQDELKRRLAYSTVSQLSYVALGVAVAGPLAAAGGLVHVVHQGIMKATLFYGAGGLSQTLGVTRVSELNGVGRRMPLTMAAFTVASLGMIGVPPLAGFVTKWVLGLGGLQAGAGWVVGVLVASSLLNAAYLLPIVYRAWFLDPVAGWPREHPPTGRVETRPTLLWPPMVTATLTLLVGVLAGAGLSPLTWASFAVEGVFE